MISSVVLRLPASTLVGLTALVAVASAAVAQQESFVARSYALPGETVFPEGLALSDDGRTFYVGSSNDGTIFRGDVATGDVTVFSPAGADGRGAIVGMDSAGDRLVVAGGSSGAITVYDASDASLVAEAATGLRDEEMFLNDVAIAPSGDAFVTDSYGQRIYRLDAAVIAGEAAPPASLDPWLDLTETTFAETDQPFINGIVVNESGRYLLVGDSGGGKLLRIAIKDKRVVEVDLGGASLENGDGLALADGRLYVVRGLITVVALRRDLASGKVVETLTDPSLSDPTDAAKIGPCLLVVNAQFSNEEAPLLPFTISAIPIPSEFPAQDGTAGPAAC